MDIFLRNNPSSSPAFDRTSFLAKVGFCFCLLTGFAHSAFVTDDFLSDALGSAWTFIDADNDAGTGAYSLTTNADILTLTGRGLDVWGSDNKFVGVYRSDITGDFDVSVKLISGTSLKAGIMIADNVATLGNGGFCILAWNGNASVVNFECDAATTVGYLDASASSASTSVPIWLRMVKKGLTLTGYYRTATTSDWTVVGSTTTPQSGAVNSEIGLFSSALSSSTTRSAQFDDFIAYSNYSTWNYSGRISFNTTSTGANVTTSQSNFPMLIKLTGSNFIFSQAKGDGSDIRFEDPDRAMLNYQIERWDTANKAAEIWVKVPTVDGNSNRDFITMYWGNNSVTSSSSGNAVFNSADNFVGTYHLNTVYTDATNNANNGTNSGTTSATGQIGKGVDFSTDYISIPTSSSLNAMSTFTGSLWLETDDATALTQALIAFYYSSTDRTYLMYDGNSYGPSAYNNINSSAVFNPRSNLGSTSYTWFHVAWVINGTSWIIYINGSQQALSAQTLTLADLSDAFTTDIGRRATADYYFDGKMDEVRLDGTARSADWIKLCYETQKDRSLAITYPTELSAWTYSSKVYINTAASGANITNNQSNYPLLIRLTQGNFTFSQALSTGADLRFADSAGNLLPYEIERFDATNKLGEIWVKIPTVYANNNSQWFKMYWGKSDATALTSGPSVFTTENNYRAVWHFAASDFTDATAFGSTLTNYGSANATGNIGGGRSFNGTSDSMTAGTSPSLTGTDDFTLSTWLKTSTSADAYFMSQRDPAGFAGEYMFLVQAAGTLSFVVYNGSYNCNFISRKTVNDNAWHHVTTVRSGTSGTIYIDGLLDSTATGTLVSMVSTLKVYIGANGRDHNSYFPGTLDDARISTTSRSADWIKLDYETQKAGSTVVSIGPRTYDFSKSFRFTFNTTSSGVNVSGNVTNIPILIRLDTSNCDFSVTTAMGTDMQFVDKGGALLYHEVVEWDKGNKTGKVWVKIPQVDGNSSTDYFTFVYGCTTCTVDPYAVKDSVWSEYKSVFHLNVPEEKAYDAATLANHGNYYKNVANSTGIVTKSSAVFDGTSDYISIPTESNYDITTNLSVWAWIKVDALDKATQAIVTKGNSSFRLNRSASTNFVEFSGKKSSTAYTSVGDDNITLAGSNSSWHHVVGTYDGSNIKLFVNGAQDGSSTALTGSLDNTADALYIGEDAQTTGRQWRGKISEVRIGNTANVLSANYITLSYKNQMESSLLFTQISTASFESSKLYKFNTSASGANVSGDVYNVPILIRIGSSIFTTIQSAGQDLRFLDKDGVTWLDYQIERWDAGTDSGEIWVKVPKVDGNSTGDFITMYYNQVSGVTVPDGQCATCVFETSNGFTGVWHLDEETAGTGTANVYQDATANDYDADDYIASTTRLGIIGRGHDFSPANTPDDYLVLGEGASTLLPDSKTRQTFSAWFKADAISVTAGVENRILGFAKDGTSASAVAFGLGNTNKVAFYTLGTATSYYSTATVSTGTWTHAALTFDGTTWLLYINGALDKTQAAQGWAGGSYTVKLGAQDGASLRAFDGHLDEIRFEQTVRSADWIKLCYENQKNSSTLFNPSPADFTSSKKYTFNTTKTGANVMGDVEDFPLLVRVTGSTIIDAIRSDYKDLRFLDGDGKTWLNYQVEHFSQTTDTAIIWVLVPKVDGNSDHDFITLYYDEVSSGLVADGQCATCVFSSDNSFTGVWHLDEETAGAAGTSIYQDATINNYDGQDMVGATDQAGIIGNGHDFDGTDDRITLGAGSNFIPNSTTSFTNSAWFKADAISATTLLNRIFSIQAADSSTIYTMSLGSTDNFQIYNVSGATTTNSNTVLAAGTWYYGVITYDGTTFTSYVNGALDATQTVSSTAGVAALARIGWRSATSSPFDGHLDEVRFAQAARSADWIKLEYENQLYTSNLFWNSRTGPNNKTTLTAAAGTNAIALSWTLPVSDSSNADSIGIWVKYSAPPDSANATSTSFVVKLPKTDSTYSYPATYPATYYFGLAVRNTSGVWSPITAASTDTVQQGGYASLLDTVYVDSAAGNDANSCASAANPSTPKLTIASAVTNCASGATDTLVIRVLPGTYTSNSFDSQSGDPIVIESFDNNSRAVLNGSGSVSNDAVTYYYTVALGDDISLRNMNVKTGTNGYQGIYVLDNTLRIQIDGCRIFNASGSVRHLNGIYLRDNANDNIFIKNNAIIEPTQYGIYITTDNNFSIVNNVLYGIGGSTKGIYMPNSSADITTISITNNIFYNWDYGIQTTDADNNIGKVDNNLFHKVTTGQEVSGETDANKIVKNPLFADTTLGSPNLFKLLTGSPAIDAGTATVNSSAWLAFPGKDLFGSSRTLGTAPDIGLYEGTGYTNTPTGEFDTLTITVGTDTIAVKNGKWKVVFSKSQGGGINRMYDMVTDSTSNVLASSSLLFNATIDGFAASAQSGSTVTLSRVESNKTMAQIRQSLAVSASQTLNLYYTLYASGHIYIQSELVNLTSGTLDVDAVTYTMKVGTAATAYTSGSSKNGFGYLLTDSRDALISVSRDLDGGALSTETWTSTATSGAGGTIVYATTDLEDIPQNMKRQHHFMIYIGSTSLTFPTAASLNADAYAPATPSMSAGSLLHERSWQNNLSGHWTFNEGGGSTALDKSITNANNAAITAATYVSGKIKSALRFDATSVAIASDHAALEACKNCSYMFWVKPDFATMGTTAFMLSKGLTTSDGWYFRKVTGVYKIAFTMGSVTVTSPTLTTSTWVHIAVTVSSSGQVYLYVDGTLVAASTSNVTATANASNLRFGENTGSGAADKFVGDLDDVRLYQTELPVAEIQAIAGRGFSARLGAYHLRADNNNRVVALLNEDAAATRMQPAFRIDNWYAGATPKYVYVNGTRLSPNTDFVSSLTNYNANLGNYLNIQLNKVITGSNATVFIDDDDSSGYLGDASKMKSLTITKTTGDKLSIRNFTDTVFGSASSGQWNLEVDLNGWTTSSTARIVDSGFGDFNSWKAAAINPSTAISSATELAGLSTTSGRRIFGVKLDAAGSQDMYSAGNGYAGPAAIGYTLIDSSATRISFTLDTMTFTGDGTVTMIKRYTVYPTGRLFASFKMITTNIALTDFRMDFAGRYQTAIDTVWSAATALTSGRWGFKGGDLNFHSFVAGLLSIRNNNSEYIGATGVDATSLSNTNSSYADMCRAGLSGTDSYFGSTDDPITVSVAMDLSKDFADSATADSLMKDLQTPATITAYTGTATPSDALDFNTSADGFAEGDGAYVYTASAGGIAHFKFVNTVTHFNPVFRIKSWSFGTLPDYVIVNNQQLVLNYQYNAYLNSTTSELIVQFNKTFNPGTHVFFISHKSGLAVTLNQLYAQGEKGGNSLHWVTESETENLGFHLWSRPIPLPENGLITLADTLDSLSGKNFAAEELPRLGFTRITDKIIPGPEDGRSSSTRVYGYLDRSGQVGTLYEYYLETLDFHGKSVFFGPVTASPLNDLETALQGNYPNPFNPVTFIHFSLRETLPVSLVIYDITGRVVKTLLTPDKQMKQGRYRVTWDATNNRGQIMATGPYFYRFRAGKYLKTKKMILLK